MSPKISIANYRIPTVRSVVYITKGFYHDAGLPLKNNFDTSFHALATNKRNVAIPSIFRSYPDFPEKSIGYVYADVLAFCYIITSNYQTS
jgi:hypothetical protein